MIEQETFELFNDIGWPIRGDVRRPASGRARGVILVAHGFKGFKDWGFFPYLGRRLAESGWASVTFNFSGNGIGDNPSEFTALDRFRRNTLTLELDDMRRVLEAARAGQLSGLAADDAGRVSLLGHSRGAVVSFCLAAGHPEVERVIAWAGVGLLGERFPEEVRRQWRQEGALKVVNSRTGQVMEMGLEALDDLEAHLIDYSPLTVAPALKQPVLLVHGGQDPTVPVAEAEAVRRAAGGRPRLHVIPGAGHTFGAVQPFEGSTPELDEAIQRTVEFLGESGKGPGG